MERFSKSDDALVSNISFTIRIWRFFSGLVADWSPGAAYKRASAKPFEPETPSLRCPVWWVLDAWDI